LLFDHPSTYSEIKRSPQSWAKLVKDIIMEVASRIFFIVFVLTYLESLLRAVKIHKKNS